MKHLIDFIETKDVSKASIFEHLKCTEEEALLIQYLCKRYVSGLEEVSVLEMLQEHFSASGYVYLEKLDLVKNLLDLGWMIQVSFGQMKAHESSKLELLSTSVTPSISLLRLLEEGSLEICFLRSSPTPIIWSICKISLIWLPFCITSRRLKRGLQTTL